MSANVATNGRRPSSRFSCPAPIRQPTTGAKLNTHTTTTRDGAPSRAAVPVHAVASDSIATTAKYASATCTNHVTALHVSVVDAPAAAHIWTSGIVPPNGCISAPPSTPKRYRKCVQSTPASSEPRR